MHTSQPIFSRPISWTLGVLSWLAFGVAAYLALKAITNSSVAGCVVGSHNGCDAVLNSSWSKWLGIPVAVLGLACYASLAGLSVMLALQSAANRWITTAFILFATLAAGASLWFIGVQVFAIGDFCMFCLATDILGIAIGAIAAWCAFRSWNRTPQPRSAGNSATTLSALRNAIPSSARLAPVAATNTASQSDSGEATPAVPRTLPATRARTVPVVGSVSASSSRRTWAPPPSMPIAYGGALALLVVLIGGQIVFPAKTYEVQQVALKDTVDLSAENGKEDTQSSNGGEPHVTLRVGTEGDAAPTDQKPDSTATASGNGNGKSSSANDSTEKAPAPSPPEPRIERELKLLGGKLTLDVADHPIIGSPNAPHVVVEIISYDCSHCRKTNRLMKKALAHYRDQVALVVLVLPLDAKCNKLVVDRAASHPDACATARTVIAMSKLKPAVFPRFHDFLMAGDEKKPPTLASILVQAYGLVDRGKLQEMRESKEVAKQIEGYVNLFGTLRQQNAKNKNFGLPVQILGDHVVSGSIEKVDDIYKAWEQHLGIKPR